ncbi:MAG: YitT family protein [Syntrophomonadaceae bacterium]|nr:YitT family protein [Syntrophomonadaceae bacterium]
MKRLITGFLLINLGGFMDAAGFYFFFAPNQIAAGGITGLSLILNSFFPQLPLGVLILFLSIILLIVGFLLIGSVFGLKTIYCSITIPLYILAMEKLIPLSQPLSDDMLIQLVFGVFTSGIGLPILFNQNASSGGTDILARILNKYYQIDLGKGLLLIDFSITILAGVVFGIEKGMYSLLGVILYGFTIDYIIEGFSVNQNVTIITPLSNQVREFIIENLERGATIYTARGAYSGDEHNVVVTIVSRREFIRLRNYIKELDPHAFIAVQAIHKVLGEGFTPLD